MLWPPALTLLAMTRAHESNLTRWMEGWRPFCASDSELATKVYVVFNNRAIGAVDQAAGFQGETKTSAG